MEKRTDPNLSLLIPRSNSTVETTRKITSKSSLGLSSSSNNNNLHCDDDDEDREDLNTLQLTR